MKHSNRWALLLLSLSLTTISAGSTPTKDYGPPIYPSFEQLMERLKEWEKEHPRFLKLRDLGKSLQGRPLVAAVLTDPDAPAQDKEHVLITAQHCGGERSGATGVFYLMQKLLSGAPQARETLRRQVVVCFPVVNPDGYISASLRNSVGMDPYKDWTEQGPKDPARLPGAVAVQTLMDELQPEVHADYHGNGMQFRGYIHVEDSAAAYSNVALRSYKQEITRQMDEAALVEGYPSDMLEQDEERIFWGPSMEHLGTKLWKGRPLFYAATYAYAKYHTLGFANENVWERSSYLRHRRLLQFGQEIWPGEYYPGYPTRVVMQNSFHQLTAYGRDASERRRSRVELWNKQDQITLGFNNPQTEGFVLYVCATSTVAAQKWLSEKAMPKFAAKIASHPAMEGKSIAEAVENLPDAPGHFDAHLYLEKGNVPGSREAPIEHGAGLRLRIPYPKARITDLRLNGRPVSISESDGYLTWVARGFTYVQLNIPPERCLKEDLFVITCAYDPGERRSFGLGWQE